MMAQAWIGLAILLIGLLTLFSAGIVRGYLRDMRTIRKRILSLDSQIVETACGPIEYATRGNGYPLLVVHGALGGFDQGLWLAQRNTPNLKVISVSRLGYLRSPLPLGANLDRQADTYAGLLDALGIPKAIVFAASAGSTSAIRFALRHSERLAALILLCPDAPPGMPQPPRFLFDVLLRSDLLYWVMITFFGSSVQSATGMVPKGYSPNREQRTAIHEILRGNLPTSQRIDGFIFETYTIDAEYKASISSDSPYPLGKIEMPVLIIHAEDDPITTPENVRRLAGKIPNARLITVPNGGHFFFGHAEEVRAEIATFLRTNIVELQADGLAERSER